MLNSDLVCRACLQKSDANSNQAFVTEETGFQRLQVILSELTLLDISNADPLPKCLCPVCCELLDRFKAFKDTCLQSDQVLRQNLVVDIKTEEGDDTKIFLPVKYETELDIADVDDNEATFDYESQDHDDEVELKDNPDGQKDETGIQCQICSKTLKNTKSLKKHLKVHAEEESDEDDSDGDAKSTSTSRKKAAQNKEKYRFHFKCHHEGCRKAYKVKEFLDAHLRSHEGIPPNVCDICHKPLSSIRAMHRHRQIHETTTPGKYSCKVCHKECVNELALINHTRKHEKGRTCVCDICGLAFYTNSSLAVHKQSHNEEKLFKCQECPRDFRTNMGLYKHRRKEHTVTQEVHVCRICDKRFPSKKFLYRHCEGTHTVYTTTENVYACIQCDAKFKNKQTLRAHAKLHTGERKYACPLCPKTFAHAAILKKHSYFHSGERPVHCEVCDKGFYQKCALDIHMNIHKRQWIAQGVQGITLYEYNRSKKGSNSSQQQHHAPTSHIEPPNSYTPDQEPPQTDYEHMMM